MQYNYSEKLKTFIDSNATKEFLAAKRCFANAQHDSFSDQSHHSHVEQSHDSHSGESHYRHSEQSEESIDELVYKLYGLTDEENGIMEGK